MPSASSAVAFSICGPSAATRIGNGVRPAGLSEAWTRYSSPSNETASPRESGPRTLRYSRRWRTGLAKLIPIIDSMTTWWLSPMPRDSRPPAAAFTVSACWASTIGCRGYVGTTLVPSSIRGTSRPTMASVVRASWPKICDAQ